MAFYQYYQNGGPWANTWGTNAYQFQSPPVPSYMPQSSWRGVDFYNAHGGGQDSSFFDYVWSKVNRNGDYLNDYDQYPEESYPGQVRNFVAGTGASRGEAEHWHRRVYGGFVQLQQLMPREIGAAAGWETLRMWQSHHSYFSTPFSGEREREREAIIGLAIAEAARLWQYVGRPLDKYGRREAGEVAGATAARIYMQLYDYDTPYDSYRGGRWAGDRDRYSDTYSDDEDFSNSYRRRGSFSGLSNYAGSAYAGTSPYAGSTMSLVPAQTTYGTQAVAVPGAGYSTGYGYGGVSPYLGSGYSTGYGYGGSVGSYPGTGYVNTVALPGTTTGYPSNYGYGQTGMGVSPGTVVIHSSRHGHGRHRSSSRHRHHRSHSYVPAGGSVYSAF